MEKKDKLKSGYVKRKEKEKRKLLEAAENPKQAKVFKFFRSTESSENPIEPAEHNKNEFKGKPQRDF